MPRVNATEVKQQNDNTVFTAKTNKMNGLRAFQQWDALKPFFGVTEKNRYFNQEFRLLMGSALIVLG